ncbi:MAG: hypothetical protein NTX49_00630 [Chlamydiae bacterium]|nr:hypothetical protein [Chlamydiota bacterium]
MKKAPLWYPFSLALFCVFFGSIILPDFRLIAFSPFFAIVFQRTSYIKSLWICFLCGLILDTFSSQQHFGLYSLCYLVVAGISYSQKKHFFEDKPLALSLFSGLISSVCGMGLLLLTFMFGRQFPITLEVIISETLVTPILDALYAFVWFTVPIKIYLYISSGRLKKIFEKKEKAHDT